MTRTSAITLVAILLVFGVDGRAQLVADYGHVTERFTTTGVGRDVYAFIAPDSRTAFVTGNSLAVIGTDAVLVVDSGHVPSMARRMIGEIRRHTARPVRYLVNTHWHPDHAAGNGEYRAAFPDLAIISTSSTRRQLDAVMPDYATATPARVAPALDMVKQMVKTGKKSDGSAVSADDRAFYEAQIEDFQAALPEVARIVYAPPTAMVEDELTIDLGGRTAVVKFLGRGNTAGDLIVYVPDAKVVATGDLLVAPVPYATGSFVHDWIGTMTRLMSLDATTVVPGHGAIQHDWQYARQVRSVLEKIDAQAAKAVDDGLTVEDARKRINLDDERKALAGSDPFQLRIFDRYFAPIVDRAFKDAAYRAEK